MERKPKKVNALTFENLGSRIFIRMAFRATHGPRIDTDYPPRTTLAAQKRVKGERDTVNARTHGPTFCQTILTGYNKNK